MVSVAFSVRSALGDRRDGNSGSWRASDNLQGGLCHDVSRNGAAGARRRDPKCVLTIKDVPPLRATSAFKGFPVRKVSRCAGDAPTDPEVLNRWLQQNKGYTCIAGDCNNLVLNAADKIPSNPLRFANESTKPELAELQRLVEAGSTVLIGTFSTRRIICWSLLALS